MNRRIIVKQLPTPGAQFIDRTREPPGLDSYETDYRPDVVDRAMELVLRARADTGETGSRLALAVGADAYLSIVVADEMARSNRAATYVWLPIAEEDSQFCGAPLFVDPMLGRLDVRLLTRGRGVMNTLQTLRARSARLARAPTPLDPRRRF